MPETNRYSSLRLSKTQALTEAKHIENPAESYQQSHNDLIKKQTKERLRDKDWLQTLKVTIDIINQTELDKKRKKKLDYKKLRKEERIEQKEERFKELGSNKKSLLEAQQRIEEGKDTINIEAFNNSIYYVLVELSQNKIDKALNKQITNKLFAALDNNDDDENEKIKEIHLTTEEIELFKKAIKKTVKNIDEETNQPNSVLDQEKEKLSEIKSQKLAIRQELSDSKIKLEVAIATLDELEEQNGAPPYPNADDPDETKPQAYKKRIEWRKEQTKNLSAFKELPPGKEIGYKWALYTKIGDKYFVLNEDTSYKSVTPKLILDNRIPEETLALSREGITQGSHITLMATINHGNIKHSTPEMKKKYEKILNPQFKNIKRELY